MYKKQIGQQILFLLSIIFMFIFFRSGILLLPLSKLSSRTENGGSPSIFNFEFTKVRPL